MKDNFLTIVFTIISLTIWNSSYAQCPNGNLENGNLSGAWTPYTSIHSPFGGVPISNLTPNQVNGRHTIMTGNGNDPIVGANIPLVSEGSHSVRLGNSSAGGQADILKYTFNVSPQNETFEFRYAMVMEDPGHPDDENPFFTYLVVKGSGLNLSPSTLITGGQFVADLSNPYYKQVQGKDIVYKEWTPVCLDLSDYKDEVVSIIFITADCNQGGHFGYAYIDGLCEDASAVAKLNIPSSICQGAPIIGDGSQCSNEVKHFWSVVECNAQGTPIGPEKSDHYFGQAGWMDLKAFYTARGGTFECDKYYRIKVAVSNNCTQWSEDAKLIHIECPSFSVGQDVVLCCDDLPEYVTLGNNFEPNLEYIYEWFDGDDIIGREPNLTLMPRRSGTYSLEVTDPATGCKGTSHVNLLLMGHYDITITEERTGDCEDPITLTASVTDDAVSQDCDENDSYAIMQKKLNKLNYSWSNGDIGLTTTVDPTQTTIFSLTASYQCYSSTGNISVTPCPEITGPFPANDFVYPNTVVPGNPFIIAHIGQNNFPAYNATEYRFVITDRWGREIVVVEDVTNRCEGFVSGEIEWDGNITETHTKPWWQIWGPPNTTAGDPMPIGVYPWNLYLKNCNNTQWVRAISNEEIIVLQ